jgi:hypothetical protein
MINIEDTTKAIMHFNTSILKYEGSDHWVEKALIDIKQLLISKDQLAHDNECEYGKFINQIDDIRQ